MPDVVVSDSPVEVVVISESDGVSTLDDVVELRVYVGVMGPKGPIGLTGAEGPQGIQGIQGLTGNIGPQGDAGPIGPQGIQGIQGIQGDLGPVGPIGPAGLTWRNQWDALVDYVADDAVFHNGSSWFASGNPGVGDEPSMASAFWFPLAVEGQQGPQGVQGIQGTEGPVGPQGVQGNIGPQGIQGVQGDLGPIGPIGPVGVEWRGTWDGLIDYVNNDAVFHNGSSWFADGNPGVGDEPSISSVYWTPLAVEGQQGIQGETGSAAIWRGAWSSGTAYVINDAVSYNGSSYVALAAVGPTATTPDVDANWQLVAAKGEVGAEGPAGTTDHAALTNLLTGDPHTQYPTKGLLTAKGDLYAATASGVIARKAVGANGRALVADSVQADGLAWSDLGATYAPVAPAAVVKGNSGAAVTFTVSAGEYQSVTFSAACTVSLAGWPASGSSRYLTIEASMGTAFAVTWPAAIKWHGGTPSLAANTRRMIVLVSRDGGTTVEGSYGAGRSTL